MNRSGKPSILVVEDEPGIAEVLRYNLERNGFAVQVLNDGLEAQRELQQNPPDLVVLDWMLPGLSGLDLCRQLSAEGAEREIPVILLTVRSEENDVLEGFACGAVDYITKPFRVQELLARVRAVLKKRGLNSEREPEDSEVFQWGTLRVDWSRHQMELDGLPCSLTLKEFKLLRALVESRGKVLSRGDLLNLAWDYREAENLKTRTVDLHISQLRKKLGRLSPCLLTVKGVGYRLDFEAEEAKSP